MKILSDPSKELRNKQKHKLDFSFAPLVFADPFAITLYDRFEGGEERWHTVAAVGHKVLLVVHSYPDPEDQDVLRVIGLREATASERRRYEEER